MSRPAQAPPRRRRVESAMKRARLAAGFPTQAAVAKRCNRSAAWYGAIERVGTSGTDRWDRRLARIFGVSMNVFVTAPYRDSVLTGPCLQRTRRRVSAASAAKALP